MDGDGDESGGPGGEVEQGPLVGGAGHQGEPVAGPEAVGDEALGDGVHLGGEDAGRDVVPRAVRSLAGEEEGVGVLAGVVVRQVGEGAAGDPGARAGTEASRTRPSTRTLCGSTGSAPTAAVATDTCGSSVFATN